MPTDKAARDHLQLGFVLHRRDFGNTSLIVEVFCGGYGRFPAVAKGAKRGRRASSTLLQPFRPLWLSWSGAGEVRTLVRSEPAGPPAVLPGRALYCGFYLNELLVRLLGRGDPHEGLFAFYNAALADLARGAGLEMVLRGFEMRLLEELGYGIPFDRDLDERPVDPARRYVLADELGLRAAVEGDTGPSVGGETLLRLAAGQALSGEGAREARDLMRRLLAPHLGGRPLKSRELFRSAGLG